MRRENDYLQQIYESTEYREKISLGMDKRLARREKILELRAQRKTLQEIASIMGISHQRVSQILRKPQE